MDSDDKNIARVEVKTEEDNKSNDPVDHHQERALPSSNDCHLHELSSQLKSLLAAPTMEREIKEEPAFEASEAMPEIWVAKWADYSEKYGFGYQLCDNSVGVLFNDGTKLALDAAGNELCYVDEKNAEDYHTMPSFPESLKKKVALLKYFDSYMSNHLKTREGMVVKAEYGLSRPPWLRYWFRTKSAIVLHLSNGTLQINFFHDHKKLIVCPLMGTVTLIDAEQKSRVFKFAEIELYGCTKELHRLLKCAKKAVEKLISQWNRSRPGASSI